MTRRRPFIQTLLEADRPWLEEQPVLRDMDWETACQRLEEKMTDWIREFGGPFLDWAGESHETRDGSTVVDGDPANGPADQPPLSCQAERIRCIWSVWKHHWQDSISFYNGAPQDGEEVAARIHQGEGFRRRQSNPATGQDKEFGKLGGNPMRDMLLVQEVIRGNSKAWQLFVDEYRPLAGKIYRERRGANPPHDWWDTEAADLAAPRKDNKTEQPIPPRIAGYKGHSGLQIPLATIIKNDVPRGLRSHQSVEEEMGRLGSAKRWNVLKEVLDTHFGSGRFEEIESQLREQCVRAGIEPAAGNFLPRCRNLLTDDEQRAWDPRLDELRNQWKHDTIAARRDKATEKDTRRHECHEALLALLVAGLQHALTNAEVELLYELVVNGKAGEEVAEDRGVHPGNVSRPKKNAVEKLRRYVAEHASDCCRQCWAEFALEFDCLLHEALITVSASTRKGGQPS